MCRRRAAMSIRMGSIDGRPKSPGTACTGTKAAYLAALDAGTVDQGSVYISRNFGTENRGYWVRGSFPLFIRQPEGKGWFERLSEPSRSSCCGYELTWIQRHSGLRSPRPIPLHQHWILQRLRYRTPAQVRQQFSRELNQAT